MVPETLVLLFGHDARRSKQLRPQFLWDSKLPFPLFCRHLHGEMARLGGRPPSLSLFSVHRSSRTCTLHFLLEPSVFFERAPSEHVQPLIVFLQKPQLPLGFLGRG